MGFDEKYRLLCSQQVRSHEDADRHQMIEEEKDQQISDEEEINMSQKPTSSYSELCERKSKIIIKEASVSALGQCSGSASVRVCDFCGKKFSSGKALGGHRRYHIQALRKMEAQNQAQQQQEKVNYILRIKSKDLVIPDNDDNNNLIKSNIGNLNSSSLRCFPCRVCDKDFPSKKSLYGHMRSHPDRDWRGMEPPFTTTDSTQASSEEFMKVQDNGSSSSTSEEPLSVPVDVSSSCSESWLKKDKRGRKSIGEAEAAHIAAQTLMLMHLYGNSHLHHRLPARDEPTSEAAALLPVKKRKNNVMTNHDCKEKIESRDGNEELEAQNNIVDMKVISIVKEKKLNNKKMKLGPDMIKSEEETVKQEEVKPSQSYVCDVCNKSFTCFQALGGHKTKHRKNIVKSTKGKEVVEQRQEEEKVEEEDKICTNGSLLSAAGLSGEEGTALVSSEERLAKNSNDNENNISNEEEVGEARQQSGSKIMDFDLNVPYVLEHEATDL